MPRARKVSPTEVPAGQPYGDRQRLEQSQVVAPPQNVPVPMPRPQQTGPSREEILSRAVAGPSPSSVGIAGPTARPGEPITAGANYGPGPGNEALMLTRKRSFTADGLERIARATGDEMIMRLAQRARMQEGA